jgi:hypothetical protein
MTNRGLKRWAAAFQAPHDQRPMLRVTDAFPQCRNTTRFRRAGHGEYRFSAGPRGALSTAGSGGLGSGLRIPSADSRSRLRTGHAPPLGGSSTPAGRGKPAIRAWPFPSLETTSGLQPVPARRRSNWFSPPCENSKRCLTPFRICSLRRQCRDEHYAERERRHVIGRNEPRRSLAMGDENPRKTADRDGGNQGPEPTGFRDRSFSFGLPSHG